MAHRAILGKESGSQEPLCNLFEKSGKTPEYDLCVRNFGGTQAILGKKSGSVKKLGVTQAILGKEWGYLCVKKLGAIFQNEAHMQESLE